MSEEYTSNVIYEKYEPRNLGNVKSHVYLGDFYSNDFSRYDITDQAIKKALGNNCHTNHMWATLIGSETVRIDRSTTDDPYIFIDHKWFDYKPFKYKIQWDMLYTPKPDNVRMYDHVKDVHDLVDSSIPEENILHERRQLEKDPIYQVKRLVSDGSIIINANNGTFFYGDDGLTHGINDIDNISDDLVLQSHRYKVGDASNEGVSLLKDTTVSPDNPMSNTYNVRNIKTTEGSKVVLYDNDKVHHPYEGLVDEPLSDILPKGVIGIDYRRSII